MGLDEIVLVPDTHGGGFGYPGLFEDGVVDGAHLAVVVLSRGGGVFTELDQLSARRILQTGHKKI
ncbi:MAG TPA: hypothetical protein VLJ59_16655 [Mycobacteriales bacterium]|nr:hypothetical protein [Mycobacteriales bacterium]